MPKRVLMLSWEYPPRIIGGLARVVAELSAKIAQTPGWEVHVVTADHPGQAEHETIKGVHVHRVKNQTDDCPDFLTWVNRLNFGMLQYAIELNRQNPFSIVHAHDWMVTDAAWVMKSGFGIPIVATMHATEAGRMHGIHNDLQRYIHQMEWRLTYESWEVIVNSQHMWGELQHSFGVPADKVVVIPNGTNPEVFDFELNKKDLRAKYVSPEEKIVLFVGRMVPEKGVQVLLNAIPHINAAHPNMRYLFVGDGYYLNDLKDQANSLGIAHLTNFLGYVSDDDLLKLYKIADIVTIPSLYEPFGIVALEGMAAKVPVVTSDTGGLTDFVEHMGTGITTYTGDSGSLAWGICELLQNHDLYKRLSTDAYEKVRSIYNWSVIAKRTLEVYDKVLAEASVLGADGVAAKPKQVLLEAAKTLPPTLPKELIPARERS
jgi:glycosyltransferase involved in cell wall biosynthesis